MSRIIATKAIRGAHKLVTRAENTLTEALDKKGPETKVEFPNTGYYLPISHGMLGLNIRDFRWTTGIAPRGKDTIAADSG